MCSANKQHFTHNYLSCILSVTAFRHLLPDLLLIKTRLRHLPFKDFRRKIVHRFLLQIQNVFDFTKRVKITAYLPRCQKPLRLLPIRKRQLAFIIRQGLIVFQLDQFVIPSESVRIFYDRLFDGRPVYLFDIFNDRYPHLSWNVSARFRPVFEIFLFNKSTLLSVVVPSSPDAEQ